MANMKHHSHVVNIFPTIEAKYFQNLKAQPGYFINSGGVRFEVFCIKYLNILKL